MNDLEFERWLEGRFSGAPEPEPPVRLLDRIATDRARPPVAGIRSVGLRRHRFVYGLGGLAATIVLAAGLLTFVGSRLQSGGPTATAPTGASAVAQTPEGLSLKIETTKVHYAAGERITVATTLTYDGAAAELNVFGPGGGLVGFGVSQVGGHLAAGPLWRLDCVPYTLRRGEPESLPFAKSGAWSADKATDVDRFVAGYVNGPDLVLPDGRWDVYAMLRYDTGKTSAPDCGGEQRSASAAVTVVVGGGAAANNAVSGANATTSDGVKLTIDTSRTHYGAGEPIPIHTTLSYPEDSSASAGMDALQVTTSGSGPVLFGVRQLSGGTLSMAPAERQSCVPLTLRRGDERDIPFTKSGGYIDDGSAQAKFAASYLRDRELVLPPGRWEIYATIPYAHGCGAPTDVATASIIVEVGPGAAPKTAEPTEAFDFGRLVWQRIATGSQFQPNFGPFFAAFGNRLFMTVNDANGTSVWSSLDGRQWQQVAAPSVFARIVGFVPQGLVAVGDGLALVGQSHGLARIWHSTDGATWDLSDVPEPDVDAPVGAASASGGAVALGEVAVWRSTDGAKWAIKPLPESAGFRGTSVTAIDGGLAAAANTRETPYSTRIWTSSDGLTWQRQPQDIPDLSSPSVVAGPGGRLVVIGVDSNGNAVSWASPEGGPWVRGGLGGVEPATVIDSAVLFDGHVVAAASSHLGWDLMGTPPTVPNATTWTSTDGVHWQRSADLPGTAAAHLFTFDGRLFAVSGSTLYVATER